LLKPYFAKDNYTNVTSTDQLIAMFVGLFAVFVFVARRTST